jgi:hypothetical protein
MTWGIQPVINRNKKRKNSYTDSSGDDFVEDKSEVTATKKDIYLDEYQKQLKLDTAKAQSEITSANKLANQYMQNYLKQQGLVGTGIGQSQYTNLATNYANAMAQLRADETNKLRQEAETYQTNRTKELGELLSTMNQTEREKYLSEIQQTEGLDQKYLDALNSQSTVLTNQEKQQKIQSQKELIATMIEAGGDVVEITNGINMLKNQGVDVSDLESLQEMSGQTIEKFAKQLYTTMKTEQSSFTGNKELYNNALNNLGKAISSNDSSSLVKAYQDTLNFIEGVPELSWAELSGTENFVNGAEYTAVETGGVNDYNYIHTGTGDDAKITLDGNKYNVTVVWSSFNEKNAKKYKGIDVKSYSKTLKEKFPNAKGGTVVYYDGEYWVYRKSNDAWGVIVQGDKQDKDASDAEALISKINGKISSQKNK